MAIANAGNTPGLPVSTPTETKGPPTASLGISGLRGAATGFLTEEFLPELRVPFGLRQYRELAENVDLIGGILLAMTMLVRSVEWRIDPANDSGKAAEQAEWLKTVLMEECRRPFTDIIEEIFEPMLVFGFKLMEPVYAKREADGSIGLLDIAPRSPETTWRWWFDPKDPDEWKAWEQVTESGFRAIIPRERLLLFRTQSVNNNPEGRSLLRSSYISYQRLKLLELAEGRQAIRAAGLVVARVPGKYMAGSASPEEKAAYASYVALATDVASDKRSAVVLPSDRDDKGNLYVDLSYLPLDTQRAAVSEAAIERYHQRMAARFLAQWILLGAQKSGGSYALASSQTDVFAVALGGWLKTIATEFNRTLIKRLWALNDFDPALQPVLAHGDLEQLDLGALGGFVQQLTAAGMPLFPDPKVENRLRAAAGLPERDPDDPPLPPPGGVQPPAPGAKPVPPGAKPPAASTPKPPAPADETAEDDEEDAA